MVSSSFPPSWPPTAPPQTVQEEFEESHGTHHLLVVLSQSLVDLVELPSPDVDQRDFVEELTEVHVDRFEEFLQRSGHSTPNHE